MVDLLPVDLSGSVARLVSGNSPAYLKVMPASASLAVPVGLLVAGCSMVLVGKLKRRQ
jgi:hypothetical protein